jgi:sterol 3beta-glucosyltransferase
MKIAVATIGSRGDVQPYVNLCQGLQAAGHDVRLATNPTLCALADAHGVTSNAVGPAVDMGAIGARLMAESFNNMWLGMIRVMQFGARLIEQAYPDVLRVCQGADLVVVSDTGCGIAEAQKLGLPWISVTLQPARIPVPNPHPTWVDRLVWPWLGQLLILPTNRFRKRVGAPPTKDITTLMSSRMILLPVSRHVAPPDPHWPPYVRPTPYWFARPVSGWAPPASLLAFLESDDKPIAVSLGVMSLSGRQSRQSAQIVLEAVRQAEVRAVVQGWDDELSQADLPSAVYHAPSLPHSWLFEQVQAVVHHGGFGTTAAVLRAGVPGVVVPHVIDQFYWGQRVEMLGAGPKFIARGRLTARRLADAIGHAVHDQAMRLRAAELGQAIRAEPDGVQAAVRLIETAV